ncbi:exosome complex exonuclease RRP42-like [Uloborus diversus]|uniref:exosome complex exonuclease RRP42-like n=1 Tax=Uloborus diversus TaxID=327109 RepID=UPI00240959E2|nr:exosome complex exonuclease RRP42-like [Uloborus diversus]
MANFVLQEAEKVYIVHGIQENLRGDGRNNMDYRMIEIETGVIPNSCGSAIIKIGDTKLLAGVSAEIKAPLAQAPNRGWIEVSIESTPHANSDFEKKSGSEFGIDVTQVLNQICNYENLVNLRSLCVIPGQQVMVLYVDIMVLGYDGNLMDAASIVTKAALYDTKLQSFIVKKDGDNEPEVEFTDDEYDVFSVDVTNLPVLVTLFRIGSEFIVDATGDEEACNKCKLLLAISSAEIVMMKEMGGPGSLHIESIHDVIEVSQNMGLQLQRQLMDILKSERNNAEKVIFL